MTDPEPLPIDACEDCGLPYQDFPCDTVLPDAEWLRIHPTGDGGLLCAGCIAKRAAVLPDTIIVFAHVVSTAEHEAFRTLKNTPLSELAVLRAAITRRGDTAMPVAHQRALDLCRTWREWGDMPSDIVATIEAALQDQSALLDERDRLRAALDISRQETAVWEAHAADWRTKALAPLARIVASRWEAP